MRLQIDKAVYGGAGLARAAQDAGPDAAGKAVFVPITLPGETVEAHITEARGSFLNAELASVLEPSPVRVAPGCPYFGTCGGCHYQHASYAAQIEIKTAILRETLERGGVFSGPDAVIAALTGDPWGYRNRIRLHVRPASAELPASLCYRQRGSHAMVRVEECPIAAPILVRVLQAIQQILAARKVDRLWEEIELFTNSDQTSVLISLTTSQREGGARRAAFETFCGLLQLAIPEVRGAAIFGSKEASRRGTAAKGGKPQGLSATWGEQSLSYTAAGFNYQVSLGSFFQVNRFIPDDLVELVTSGAPGGLAWDLYAGVGLFARALTRRFSMVRAVESSPLSCADLRINLEGTTHKVVESSTLDFLRVYTASSAAKKKSGRPDLVVVDPPRAGLGSEVTSLLACVAPAEIVYVSCDPATLARDLRTLIQSGYQIQKTTMVDMFPQTYHLESVSRLSVR